VRGRGFGVGNAMRLRRVDGWWSSFFLKLWSLDTIHCELFPNDAITPITIRTLAARFAPCSRTYKMPDPKVNDRDMSPWTTSHTSDPSYRPGSGELVVQGVKKSYRTFQVVWWGLDSRRSYGWS
jgi:hypothetical protein